MTERTEPLAINLQEVPVRRLVHITAGNPDWTPTEDQLTDLISKYQEAERGSGILATRSGVRIHSVVVEIPDEVHRCEQWVISAALAYSKNPDSEFRADLRRATSHLTKLREQKNVACGTPQ